MPSCPGRIEDISAFLDGELDRDEELELRRHLDDCELCAAWHHRLELFSEGLARSLGRERAPASLARRVGVLRRPNRSQQIAIGLAGVAALVAVTLLLGRTIDGGRAELSHESLVDAGSGSGSNPNAAAALQLIEDHHRWTSGETALAVSSSDASEIARGLSARLPFQIGVAGIVGASLRGGQDCSLAEGRAAYLQYERAGELVSVFVAPRLMTGTDGGPDGDGNGNEQGDEQGKGRNAGEASCRWIGDDTLCTFRRSGQTIAVVAARPETARSFERAAWIVDPPRRDVR